MNCWQCGAQIPPDAGFCRACGAFLRPRSAPVSRPDVASPNPPLGPPRDGADSSNPLAAPSAECPSQSPTPAPGGYHAEAGSALPEVTATGTRSWAPPPQPPWAPAQSRTATPAVPETAAGPSSLGDIAAAAGAGFVIISLMLTWYQVTITAAGMQFYQSLFSRLFPGAASELGGLTGPLTLSVSALDKEAGGWRWAIIVVSAVLVLEVLLAVGSGVARQVSPTWPHASILLVLTVVNLILVAAAFFARPGGGTSSLYLTVSNGIGAYLGLVAAIVAFGGGVAQIMRSSSSR